MNCFMPSSPLVFLLFAVLLSLHLHTFLYTTLICAQYTCSPIVGLQLFMFLHAFHLKPSVQIDTTISNLAVEYVQICDD